MPYICYSEETLSGPPQEPSREFQIIHGIYHFVILPVRAAYIFSFSSHYDPLPGEQLLVLSINLRRAQALRRHIFSSKTNCGNTLRFPAASCEHHTHLPEIGSTITRSLQHATLKTGRRYTKNLLWLIPKTRSGTKVLFLIKFCCEIFGGLTTTETHRGDPWKHTAGISETTTSLSWWTPRNKKYEKLLEGRKKISIYQPNYKTPKNFTFPRFWRRGEVSSWMRWTNASCMENVSLTFPALMSKKFSIKGSMGGLREKSVTSGK